MRSNSFGTKYSQLDDVYASLDLSTSLPKTKFPQDDRDPRNVFAAVRDELMLDGNSCQSLATFCQAWVDEEIRELMDLSIDKDEYSQTAEIEARCVHMIADLWNFPDAADTMGCSTTGSSEAAILGGLALKWQWRKRREAEGKSTDRPNLICAPVQICCHKFGLAPLGAGWIIWREAADLPEELVFNVNYLGGNMPSFALNFSRPGGQIIAQHYNFLRLGRSGYAKIHNACYATAQYLFGEIAKLGPFEIIFDGDSQKSIPALAWKLKKDAAVGGYTLYDICRQIIQGGTNLFFRRSDGITTKIRSLRFANMQAYKILSDFRYAPLLGK